jgi:hypothetical protein
MTKISEQAQTLTHVLNRGFTGGCWRPDLMAYMAAVCGGMPLEAPTDLSPLAFDILGMLFKPSGKWSVYPRVDGLTHEQVIAGMSAVLRQCWRKTSCTCPRHAEVDGRVRAACPAAKPPLDIRTLAGMPAGAACIQLAAQLLTGQASHARAHLHGWECALRQAVTGLVCGYSFTRSSMPAHGAGSAQARGSRTL